MAVRLLEPVVSEKSSGLLEQGVFTFYVAKDLNKIELAKLIEKQFDVVVEKINMLNQKPKKRRRGRIVGKTKARSKAYVKVKSSSSMEKIRGVF